MFDIDSMIADCLGAVRETDPQRAVRDVVVRALEDAGGVSDALAKDLSGLNVLYNTPELTVLNVIWAPKMVLYPHDHRMWAIIGIYGGVEDNTLYRRAPDGITRAGGRVLQESDVLSLGADAIHSVANPERRFTGAIHVYGGDFVNEPRSQWDPDTLIEERWDLEQVRKVFAAANAEWAAQTGTDVDESAV